MASPLRADAGRVFLVQEPRDPARSTPSSGRVGLEPRPRRRAGLGRLPGRPDHRRDARPAWSPSSLEGKGLVEWQYDLGVATTAKGPPSPGPFARGRSSRRSRAREARLGPPEGLPDRRQPDLLPEGRSGPARLRRRHRPARLVLHGRRAGKINPHLLVGPRRIVLQVRKPNADARARLRQRGPSRSPNSPQVEEEEWPRDPLAIDDDHVALVADRMTVALFDTSRGVNAWIFQRDQGTPQVRPPPPLRRRGAAPGPARWPRPDPARPVDRRQDLGLVEAPGHRRPERTPRRRRPGGRPGLRGQRDDPGGRIRWGMARPSGSGAAERPGRPAGTLALTDRSVAAYPRPAEGARDQDDLAVLPMVFHRRGSTASRSSGS